MQSQKNLELIVKEFVRRENFESGVTFVVVTERAIYTVKKFCGMKDCVQQQDRSYF